MEDHSEETVSLPRLEVPVSSINLLVVDDNPANRLAFRSLLEPLGYSVFVASSGHEALALATRYHFAVMLLDVRMPVLDGIETAVLLKKKPFSRNAPVIFISAHQATAEEVSRVSLEGMIGYVHSPVDSQLLIWKVKIYVQHYLKNEELRLQAALALQAFDEHRKRLGADPKAGAEVRQSGERLGQALESLRDTLSNGLGVLSS